MNDKSKSAAAGHTTRPKIVIERTYRAKVGGTLGIVDHESRASSRGGGPTASASKSMLSKHAWAAHCTTT